MKQLIIVCFILLIYPAILFAGVSSFNVDSLIRIKENTENQLTNDEQIELLSQIGDALKHSVPDSSIYYYNLAILKAKDIQDYNAEAALVSKIGGAKYILGEYDFALDNFVNALNIWRNIQYKKGIAIGLNNVALIYNVLGDNEKALENHLNSAQLCKEVGDSALLAKNYFNISIVNLDLNNFDLALAYGEKSFQISSLLHIEGELLKLNNLFGNIYLKQGRFILAREAFLKVVNRVDSDNKWELSYALAGLAAVEQKLGNLDASISYGHNSLKLAKEIQANWDIQNATKVLSESYALNNDFENAYAYYKEYKSYSDGIFNEEKERRIDYLLLKQNDFDYIMLTKENEEQIQKIHTRNILIFSAIFGLILLMLLAIILYRSIRNKIKLNTQLYIKNAEIDNKNKELTQLNTTKDTFFRILGHDLKSPMSTVVSFTDMLQNNYDQFSKEEILEYIGITKKSALNTIDLLENLLEWAKVQTGLISIKLLKTNILQMINEDIDHLHNVLISKNIILRTDVESNITTILDRNMTASILRNLLSNAIKFTPENGEIKIRAHKENKGVLISITDNGIGMSKEKVDNLFQIENASSSLGTNNEKGTGIGLLLCKDFAKIQGGEIWVESEQGKGSTFYLRL